MTPQQPVLLKVSEYGSKLVESGIKYGYYNVNAKKTWIILKSEHLVEKAKRIFEGTEVQITIEGKRHLGVCIGSTAFKDEYCAGYVNDWCKQLEKLCYITKVNPHAAYNAYSHSFQHKLTYYLRTIEGFEQYLMPLDDLITYGFLPTLFGAALTPVERRIMALPIRYGGMGIQILQQKAPRDFQDSTFMTADLVSGTLHQSGNIPPDNQYKINIVKEYGNKRCAKELESIKTQIWPQVKRCLEIAAEKGASNWLAALPIIKNNTSP